MKEAYLKKNLSEALVDQFKTQKRLNLMPAPDDRERLRIAARIDNAIKKTKQKIDEVNVIEPQVDSPEKAQKLFQMLKSKAGINEKNEL
jgi:hypothetical protein